MWHPMLLRAAKAHVLDSLLANGMDEDEAIWRMRRLHHGRLNQAIEKAKSQSPDFVHAFAALGLRDDESMGAIGDGTLWQRILDFFASPAGQILLTILKALLLLLPFILSPTPPMQAAPGGHGFLDRPFRDLAYTSRTFRAIYAQWIAHNRLGPGGALELFEEFCERFAEPELMDRIESFFNEVKAMSLDYSKILADLIAVKTAVSAGAVSPIVRSIGVLTIDAADVIDAFSGTPTMQSVACTDPVASQIVACCEDITAAIAAQPVMASGGPVGTWGDGTYLKLFFEYAPQLLALIMSLFKPKPAPTP